MARIKITLDEHVRVCDHCGVKNLKRTFHIQLPDGDELYIGRICVSRMLGVDTSGNPHRARIKLEEKLNEMDLDDIHLIIDEFLND